MKIDQIAYYCNSDIAAQQLKEWFGLQDKEWIKDVVTGRSTMSIGSRTYIAQNVAELQFNYDLGIELEILKYIQGDHFHMESSNLSSKPYISHVGIHLEDHEDFPQMSGAKLIQETFTISHTAEYLTKPGSPGYGRTYHYRIFQAQKGSFIKYIKRIHPKNHEKAEG